MQISGEMVKLVWEAEDACEGASDRARACTIIAAVAPLIRAKALEEAADLAAAFRSDESPLAIGLPNAIRALATQEG